MPSTQLSVRSCCCCVLHNIWSRKESPIRTRMELARQHPNPVSLRQVAFSPPEWVPPELLCQPPFHMAIAGCEPTSKTAVREIPPNLSTAVGVSEEMQKAKATSEEELRALQAQIKEGISKIDAQMKPKPLWQRIRAHVGKNSNNMIFVSLAGSLMVVAYGRLTTSRQLQVSQLDELRDFSSR